MEDTIAAISTAIGEGGIAIVRVSGPRALEIADAIFVSRRGRPSDFSSHTIHLGAIGTNADFLDRVMLTVMRSPRTYTTEDVVEINCHGGLLNARNILSRCLQHGARAAEPGEFTKRAFLNGRLDLTQAEAVMDLISAKTDRAQAAAAHALEGHLSHRIETARDQLITTLAHIEAHIDFPDEDITPHTRDGWMAHTEGVAKTLAGLLATAKEGKIVREGVSIAIVGRPNVGKSSLMNALLGQQRSIVTPIPGTTRDTIEALANVRGIPVTFTDTAGLRRPRGTVEKIGVSHSRNCLQRSPLVIHVLDLSRRFSKAELELAHLYENKPAIHVLNKSNLPKRLDLPSAFPLAKVVEVSCLRGDGIDQLRDAIESTVLAGSPEAFRSDVLINDRHAEAIRRALKALDCATDEMKRDSSAEIISQQVRLGLDAIGEIVGKTSTEDVLEKIFSTFCIGK